MKLSNNTIKSITLGACEFKEEGNSLGFCRLSHSQRNFYLGYKNNLYYDKAAASAGIRLEFYTNSTTLNLKLRVSHADTVTWFRHDIYVNGERAKFLEGDLKDYPDNVACITTDLILRGDEKHIAIYLPWSCETRIISLELDDHATVSPVETNGRIIFYGDSITHGARAVDSSKIYTTRVSESLDLEGINKGMGGDIMQPDFARIPDPIQPSIVVVAFGTNDWKIKSPEEFDRDCELFYKNIRASYPKAKIFALSPIWRPIWQQTHKAGTFFRIRDKIRSVAASIDDVIFVDGLLLVPHAPEMLADGVHPCDEGFRYYAENLTKIIKENIL